MAHAAFLIVAVIAIGSALGLVLRRNAIHGALLLVINLGSIAALYLMMGAEFLAAAQVIVYAGAIMVLFVLLVLVVGRRWAGPAATTTASGTPDAVGRLLFTSYLFPFELTSVLLLAAMVGVLVLARRRA